MEALKQYIDLYKANKDLIDRGSASAMNALRDKACRALEHHGLPKKGSEHYEITDLEAVLAPDFGLNLGRLPVVGGAIPFRCALPMLTTTPVTVMGDVPVNIADLPDGVTVMSLRQAALEEDETLMSLYGSIADLDNPITALDTMLAQDGLYIHIAKGVKCETPLQVVNIMEHGAPMMVARRVLIVVDEEASAKVLFCDHTRDQNQYLALQTAEVFVGPRAALDIYDLEETTDRTARLSTFYLRQAEQSDVLVDVMTLYNGVTRNEYFSRFAGEGASLKILGMAIEDESRIASNRVDVRHDVGGCNTDELFKYVVDDEARGGFTGRIYVAPGAAKTEAYQSNRNIIGAPGAKIYSKPQLEIYNDDVKCSHGTTIGSLDERQLFYMQTRGIPRDEAKRLLRQAFMSDVINGIRLPALRDRLHALVERRFYGAELSCTACSQE